MPPTTPNDHNHSTAQPLKPMELRAGASAALGNPAAGAAIVEVHKVSRAELVHNITRAQAVYDTVWRHTHPDVRGEECSRRAYLIPTRRDRVLPYGDCPPHFHRGLNSGGHQPPGGRPRVYGPLIRRLKETKGDRP